jgi:glycosyltransferase involved in cell wall biosynthesis
MSLISILIANYNNGQYISETLDSILHQTYKDIEIIIVDDYSTDNSIQLIEDYQKAHPEIQIELFINSVNEGCGFTKRKCVEKARGEYFAFLDPEDTIVPEAVEILLEQFGIQPELSIVYSTHYLCNEKLEPQSVSEWPGEIPAGESHLTSTGGHISAFALCKKACYDKTLGINPKFVVSEDQDMYLKMEEVAQVYFVNQPLYYYRKHENNISWNDKKRLVNAYWTLVVVEDAYRRRKSQHGVSNLNFIQVKRRRLLYYLLLFKSNHIEKKQLKACIYLIKAVGYIYADNHFYILRAIKNRKIVA